MPSFTTIYRAVVMIAMGVIVVKGWQLYGPSTEQMKTFAVAAMETAQTAWNKSRAEGADDATADGDPRVPAPPVAAIPPATGSESAPPHSTPGLAPSSDSAEVTAPELAVGPAVANDLIPSPGGNVPAEIAEVSDDMPALFSQLTAMGVSDQQLTPWGSSGRLYRFCCRAKLADTPFHTRHFEAVAERPAGAVQRVIAEVEAWRTAQREQTAMR